MEYHSESRRICPCVKFTDLGSMNSNQPERTNHRVEKDKRTNVVLAHFFHPKFCFFSPLPLQTSKSGASVRICFFFLNVMLCCIHFVPRRLVSDADAVTIPVMLMVTMALYSLTPRLVHGFGWLGLVAGCDCCFALPPEHLYSTFHNAIDSIPCRQLS